MVGKIGRHLRKLSGDKYRVSTIFALDPAGPGFEERAMADMEPISLSDADYVQIIHTNGGMLGMQFRCGTIGKLIFINFQSFKRYNFIIICLKF